MTDEIRPGVSGNDFQTRSETGGLYSIHVIPVGGKVMLGVGINELSTIQFASGEGVVREGIYSDYGDGANISWGEIKRIELAGDVKVGVGRICLIINRGTDLIIYSKRDDSPNRQRKAEL